MSSLLDTDTDEQEAYIQADSVKFTRNSFDVTLIDPAVDPVIGGTLEWDHIDPWTGTIVGVEANTWTNGTTTTRFVKVTATNEDVLADGGTANIALSDTPDDVDSFVWRKLVLSRRLKDATTEVRCRVQIDFGAWPGPIFPGVEIAVTSAADGLSADVFTLMDWTVSYLSLGITRYDLDLGLGDFATATTSAADGGPLDPVTMPEYIIDQADVAIDQSLDGGPPEGAIHAAIAAAACPGLETPWGTYDPPAYIGHVYQSGDCGTEGGTGGDYQFFDSTGASLLGYIEGGAIVFAGSVFVQPTDWDATDPINGQFSITGLGYAGTVTMFGRVNCEQPTPPE